MGSAICYGLASLAFVSLIACGGPDRNMQPQTPDLTATTGATAHVEPKIQPGTPSAEPAPIEATSPAPAPGTRASSEPAARPPIATWGIGRAPVPSPTSMESSAAVNDEQIAAVLAAANAEEVEEGRLVAKKTKDARVRRFADQIAMDHDAADAKLRSLDAKDGLTAREGPLSDDVKEGAERVMISLRSGPAADFDKAYIDAQVEQHQNLLRLIDRFIPQTKNVDLKSYLSERRAAAAEHLRRAQEIGLMLEK
jgi:putative membrane protein